MNYYTFQPPASLAAYVRFFWVLEGEATTGQPYVHRSMADGCAELLFHYNGIFDELAATGKTDRSFSSGLSGQSQYFRRFSIDRNFGIFGVYLYPYAVTDLLGIHTADSKNQMIDLNSLFGSEAAALEEKIMLAHSNKLRVQILTAFLEKRLLKRKLNTPGIAETIQQMIHSGSLTQVEELAKNSFLSTRQFERKFKEYAGFSPKLYSRILRFQKTISWYGTKSKSLIEIAHDAGYYDQSHFIHDFREFSGHNPQAYFSGMTESTDWKE